MSDTSLPGPPSGRAIETLSGLSYAPPQLDGRVDAPFFTCYAFPPRITSDIVELQGVIWI